MASQSEIALVNPMGQTETAKSRKTRTRQTKASKTAKRASARKSAKTARETDSPGTDVVPVMKLRAIDIVDDARTKSANGGKSDADKDEPPHVIQMPPVQMPVQPEETASSTGVDGTPLNIPGMPDGEHPVSDPELLELLEQLSATIDTANTVLDAASTVPGEDGEPLATNDGKAEPKPEPSPEPEPETEQPPPLAAQTKSEPAPEAPRSKDKYGFGLVANAALTGLVFAAGIAWLLHTNPWLLEQNIDMPVTSELPAAIKPAKQGTALSAAPAPDTAPQQVDVVPAAEPTFTPPEAEPAPMEMIRPQQPAPAATLNEPARGPAGQPIALNISLPAQADGAEMSVMVQGVPDKAKLSAGKDLGSGNWLLSDTQMQGLTLDTGKGFKPGTHELEVIPVTSDGKVPETLKVPVTVEKVIVGPIKLEAATQPATANASAADVAAPGVKKTTYVKSGVAVEVATPAPASPAAQEMPAPTLTPQEIRTLLSRGNTLLREGDVAGARLLLEYAAHRGSKQAMVKLGNSYDPKYLTKLGVRGVQPNEAKAVHWYDRASKAGNAQ